MSGYTKYWSLELGGRSAWAMLAKWPEWWAELVAPPTLGAAAQHLLLDQADTQAREDARTHAVGYLPGEADPSEELSAAEPAPAVSEELLLALPELADLSNPGSDRPQDPAPHRLPGRQQPAPGRPRRRAAAIGRRHGGSPRPTAAPAREAAHGYEFDGRVRRLAEDLGLLSANPEHLAGACADFSSVLVAQARQAVRVVNRSGMIAPSAASAALTFMSCATSGGAVWPRSAGR
ncbi:hypothetical protein ACWF9B_21890 [Streptomyces sp. NPDC055089]